MIATVEKVSRTEPRKPEWGQLEARIRAGAERRGVSLRQLGLAIGLSHAAVTEPIRFRRPMGRDLLIALADYFEESREEWQEMGGFDLEGLPQDRGFTTAERTVARWLKGLSDEDRTALLRRAAEEQRHQDGDI